MILSGPNIRAGVESHLPGVLLSATIGMAAAFVSGHHGGPTLLYALLFGIAFHSLTKGSKAAVGIGFCGKSVLRVGVALLGARISFSQISSLGWPPILIVLSGVVGTIVFGIVVARLAGVSRDFGVLTGGAVAICGASAALAISAVLPNDKERERNTLFTVVAVTILSTIAMIAYPLLARSFGLNDQKAGLLLGATIHDVAQVVAAGHMISEEAGLVATYVKLLRVALLLPVVVSLAWLLKGGTDGSSQQPVPLFLIAFAVLVVANSAGLIHPMVAAALATTSKWCLILAIAALGMKTSFEDLAQVGLVPLLLIGAETLFLLGLVGAGLWLIA